MGSLCLSLLLLLVCVSGQDEVQLRSIDPTVVSTSGCSDITVQLQTASCSKAFVQQLRNSALLVLSSASGSAFRPTDLYSSTPVNVNDNCASLRYKCFTSSARPGQYLPKLVLGAGKYQKFLATGLQVLSVVDAPVASFVGLHTNLSTATVDVLLSVGLSSTPQLPTSVVIRLEDPSEATVTQPQVLRWKEGEAEPKHLKYVFKRVFSSSLQARLEVTSNARISEAAGVQEVDLRCPTFRFVSDQVVFRDEDGYSAVAIPVVRGSPSPLPSVLSYRTELLNIDGCFGNMSAVCMSAISASGVVQFQPYVDTAYAVVGILWDKLPVTAAVTVGLNLTSIENANVADQSNDTALTVYGVWEGQCPPGTMGPAVNGSSTDSGSKDNSILDPASEENSWQGKLVSPYPSSPSCSTKEAVKHFLQQQASKVDRISPVLQVCIQGTFSIVQAAVNDSTPGTVQHNFVFRRPAVANATHIFIPANLGGVLEELVTINSSCSSQAQWQEATLDGSSGGSTSRDAEAGNNGWYYWSMVPQPTPCSVVVALYSPMRTGTSSASTLQQQQQQAKAFSTLAQSQAADAELRSGGNDGGSQLTATTRANGGEPKGANATPPPQVRRALLEQQNPWNATAGRSQGSDQGNGSSKVTPAPSRQPAGTKGPAGGAGARSASGNSDGGVGPLVSAGDELLFSIVQRWQYHITVLPSSPLSMLGSASLYLTDRFQRTYWPLCAMPKPLVDLAMRCLMEQQEADDEEEDDDDDEDGDVPSSAGQGNRAASGPSGSDLVTLRSNARRLLAQAVLGSPSAISDLGGVAVPEPTDEELLGPGTGTSQQQDQQDQVDSNGGTVDEGDEEEVVSFTLQCGAQGDGEGDGEDDGVQVYVNHQYLDACDPHQALSVDLSVLDSQLLLEASSNGQDLDMQPPGMLIDPTKEAAQAVTSSGGSAGSGGSLAIPSISDLQLMPSSGEPCTALFQPSREVALALVAPDAVTTRAYALHLYDDMRNATAAALACARQQQQQGTLKQQQQQDVQNLQGGPGGTAADGSALRSGNEAAQGSPIASASVRNETVFPMNASSLYDVCLPCAAGSFSTDIDSRQCYLCEPGSAAGRNLSMTCSICPPGTFAYAFGSTQCRSCPVGTFSLGPGSVACNVCPAGLTTANEGARKCASLPRDDDNNGLPYAWVVSFRLRFVLSGASLARMTARTTGINATGATIMQVLVRADTAEAFKVAASQVSVSEPAQADPSSYAVNVSLAVPVARVDEGGEAPKDMDADKLIERLIGDPPRAFPRTSEATRGAPMQVMDLRQHIRRIQRRRRRVALHAILWPTLLSTLVLAAALAFFGCKCARQRRARNISLPPMSDVNQRRWWESFKEATSPAVSSPELQLQDIGGPSGGAGAQAQLGPGVSAAQAQQGVASTSSTQQGHMAPRQRVRGKTSSNADAVQAYDLQLLQVYYEQAHLGPRL